MTELVTIPERKAMRRSLGRVRMLEPTTYVELGVRRAETSRWLYDILTKQRSHFRLVGVDFSDFAKEKWRGNMPRRLVRDCNIEFLPMTTSEAAKRKWSSHLIWVFIDACHCFQCATEDILTWGGMLESGGQLLVHDTTDARRHYRALFQHYEPDVKKSGTRRFGVWEAVQSDKPAGKFLRDEFVLMEEVQSDNGMQIWQKN